MRHLPENFSENTQQFEKKYRAKLADNSVGYFDLDYIMKGFDQLELAETEEEIKQALMIVTMAYLILSTNVLLDIDLHDDVSKVMGEDIKILAAKYWKPA